IGNQSAGNDASTLDHLVGIGQVDVETFCDARRTNRGFPAMHARAFDRERKENIGVAERIVIEKVESVHLETGEVKSPAAKRDGEPEFALLVGFAVKRQEARASGIEKRTRNGGERRGLIETAVGSARNPVEFGNAKGDAEARIGFVFFETAGKMSEAHAGVEGEPFGEAELIFAEDTGERAVWLARLRRRRRSAVGVDDAEEGIVLLGETVETEARVVFAARDGEIDHAAFVMRIVMVSGDGNVVDRDPRSRQITVIRGAIPMEEGRDREEHSGAYGVHPGKITEDVALALDIAGAELLLVGCVWDLEIVAARGTDETELIFWCCVKDE